ncbi:c-type cytochrome domain-containing protein [Algoriphagus mannitolivorans]|uniref:c-type cytochrome domain-containing protein n=1 Tax=Algoriphagus mannitolivorans TaxID=226504 RepID=UPI0004107DED|nr:c-type cytochrome domain-containing protein [Algoriphagus mannitolivorans]
MTRPSRIISGLENLLFFWLGLTTILIIGGNNLAIPAFLQVFGRLHPLILHFPIVILLMGIATIWIKEQTWKDAGRMFLLLGSNFAGITVVAGLILAAEDYEGNSLDWHKWLGIISLALSIFIYFLVKKPNLSQKTFSSFLAICLILTGHFGANLTHGEDFLLAPIQSKEEKQIALEEAEIFGDLVMPIFETKCISCHKEGKIKGELRLDDLEALKKGGESGPFLVAGDPENSLFLQKIHLPLEDEEHMPPKNKTQLTDEEIELLKTWVASGASFDQKISELEETSPLYILASQKFSAQKTYEFDPASDSDIQSLNNFFRKVKPLHPESPALEVAYFGASSFDPNSLKDFKKIKNQVVKVNLNRMPLEGVSLQFLEDLKNLEELQMNFTGLQPDQIQVLEKLPNLKKLAISGNNLGPESMAPLSKLNQLNYLYFWESGLSEEQKKELQKNLQKTKIDFGFNSKGVILALNPPKIEFENSMFGDSAKIELSHPIRSAQLRYTLDGSEPDSTSSLIYSNVIFIKESSEIKVKAFAPEWIGSSPVKAVLFKKGRKPESASLTHEPNPKYKAQEVQTLFDGVKGKANHTSGEWLGYSEKPFEVILKINPQAPPKQLQASLLLNESAYIFPPESVDLWISSNGTWKKVKIDSPSQSEKFGEVRYELLKYELPKESFEEIRLTLKPISQLPKWHPGAGSKGWVFVDEIFIY